MSDKDSGDAQGKRARTRLEGVIPELLKRAVELGVEKAAEAPDNLKEFVGGLKIPKEIAHLLLTQVEETKNGLFRVVGSYAEGADPTGVPKRLLSTEVSVKRDRDDRAPRRRSRE
jgi:hypothetical protein